MKAWAWILGGTVLCWAGVAAAHRVGTAYLEVAETGPGRAVAVWVLPGPSREAMPAFPPRCQVREGLVGAGRSQHSFQYFLDCPGGLRGQELGVTRLGVSVSSAALRIAFADGSEFSTVLTPSRSHAFVPVGSDVGAVALAFVELGFRHILSGLDHLLFVLGIVWLAGSLRRVLATVTTFTLAHSITLAGTALGWIRVPTGVAEACIALSLVLVALDLRAGEGTGSPASGHVAGGARHPEALAFAFGLVHGFGFAGALSDVGMPEQAVVPALLAFNVGVELGQLCFVALCLGLGWLVVWRAGAGRRWLTTSAATATAYTIGSLGAWFTLERVIAWLPH